MTTGSLLGMAIATVGLFGGRALADNVTVDKFPTPDVQVQGLGADATLTVQVGATQKHYPLNTVDHISLEAAPQFSVAEDAAANAKSDDDWAKAADLYVAAQHAIPPELKQVGEARAIKALDNAGRFKEATADFLDVLDVAPAVGTFDLKPTNLPDAGSKLLADSAYLVSHKLTDKNLQDPDVQKQLKMFLLEMYEKAGDSRAAALAHDLGQTTPGEAVDAGSVSDGSGDTTAIDQMIAGKKFSDAIAAIDAQLPNSKGDTAARLLAAEAQAYEGLGDKDSALLTYLRLGTTLPDNSYAPNALLKAAELEKTTDPTGASALYGLIVKKYPDSPAALMAQKNQR